ncbi:MULTISPECIES: Tn3 family transposase [Streptomyces]|uniref:Tn3 transposase DDE domain-containing protein n=1 Tax=Streptomyces canarius TaxID=285453 RepID=A0ABQ3D434_9ACTN|nr:Tn3 family transposase [Streptomyces canarius]GHA56543.1 hypothetical protein GCM10010345_71300 [Streptomyces canarius]
MTEYHARYGGNGTMIYRHAEKENVCISSQRTCCSSAEVAAVIEGLPRHCANAENEADYVDTTAPRWSGSPSPICSTSARCLG